MNADLIDFSLTYWYKKIWDSPGILFPRVPVLYSAALDISRGSVNDHEAEKHRIEPRKRTAEAGYETPCDGKVGITGIVDLAS